MEVSDLVERQQAHNRPHDNFLVHSAAGADPPQCTAQVFEIALGKRRDSAQQREPVGVGPMFGDAKLARGNRQHA